MKLHVLGIDSATAYWAINLPNCKKTHLEPITTHYLKKLRTLKSVPSGR
jgi:hypothetical protein